MGWKGRTEHVTHATAVSAFTSSIGRPQTGVRTIYGKRREGARVPFDWGDNMKSQWKRRASWRLIVALFALFGASAVHAQATQPVCGDEVKYAIAKLLASDATQKDPASEEAIALQKKVYAQYSYCATIPNVDIRIDKREFCSALSFVGNLGYERMPCCGYDPQKQLFGCPIRIERTYGFGAPFVGSYEHVLTCVDFGWGYVPVARDSVHLSDAVPVGGSPPWQFAVIAKAYENLSSLPLKGQVYRARSILSWAFTPTSCEPRTAISGNPVPWGNTLDYQIRLDP